LAIPYIDKKIAKEEIGRLVEKYNKVLEENRVSKYNEEMTKKDFILPLFRALGWNIEDSTEVTAEEKISKKRVDYGFRINGIPKFFLEAKPLKGDVDNPKFFEQAVSYAWHKGCTWAVLTDFEAVKILNAEWKAANYLQSHFMTIRCYEFLKRFDELWLLSKESFEQGLLDKEAERWGKKTKKSSIDKQLLADFTRFRGMLSKNITKLNQSKNLTEEELDESVQRILDRLIFIRNCEDRELEAKTLISSMREWESRGKGQFTKNLREVFAYFDKEYNSKIFAEHLCDDLEIDNEVLQQLIRGLYYTKDKFFTISYDFSAIDADVLGNIYEQYLSHILKKTQKRAKLTENRVQRKKHGIYYTPTYIVDYIVRNTLGELLKDKKVNVEKIRVLDPACGSGSFLIKSFDVLNDYYLKNDKDYAQSQLDLKTRAIFTKKVRILRDNIFGVDLDKQAVEIAQLNLLLKIAEKKHRLPFLEQNIKCGNSLIDDKRIAGDKAFKWKGEFKEIMKEGGFDVIIGNPPYVKLQNLDKNQIEFFYSNYDSAKKHYDIYVLFVEKGLSLLKKGGILGFILPSKFFITDYGAGLRKFISKHKCILQIVNFKGFQVFDEATTYTCLLLLRKSENKTFDYFEIGDKNKLEQTKILSSDILRHSVQEQPAGDEAWNFSSYEIGALLSKLKRNKLTLGGISQDIFQGFLSGRDRFFFVNVLEDMGSLVKVKNSYVDKEHVIERALLKKMLKGKDIRRWEINWKNLFVIYPYQLQNHATSLIPLQKMKADHPKLYRYLLTYKKN